jgi:hypothetical protein
VPVTTATKLGVLRLQQGRGDLVRAERAEPDERPAEFFPGWRRVLGAGGECGERGSDGGFQKRAAFDLHDLG